MKGLASTSLSSSKTARNRDILVHCGKQCMRTVVDMIRMLPEDYQNAISVYDDLCSSIACHWGPNAFGFIYVKGNDVV